MILREVGIKEIKYDDETIYKRYIKRFVLTHIKMVYDSLKEAVGLFVRAVVFNTIVKLAELDGRV